MRPGMFVRARIVLDEHEAGAIVPLEAVTRRGDAQVIFVLEESGETRVVREVEVEAGIAEGERVEIVSPLVAGRVVTLGQHLLDDGSAVNVANTPDGTTP